MRQNIRHRSFIALSIAVALCTAIPRASAVPVLVEVEGRIVQNTFLDFPFSGTPLGTRVVYSCVIESTSGFEFVPGFRLGMRMTNMRLRIDASSNGPMELTNDLIRSAHFATTGITSAIPPTDSIEFDPLTFSFGAIDLRQTLKLIDGDNVSWPSADLAQLKPCGVPGANFANPAVGDRKHWYIESATVLGAFNIELIEIRQAGTSAGDGDMDESGSADGDDLQPFTTAVLELSTDSKDVCHGDFSLNGVVDPADIAGMVNVLLTGVIPPPMPPSGGACCYFDVNFVRQCQFVATAAACDALPGFDQRFSFAKSCEQLDPPCGGGSCCYPDGSCETLGLPETSTPDNDCFAAGGFFNPDMGCVPNTCPGAPIGCCLVDEFFTPTGQCVVGTPDECAALGGIAQAPGILCDPNPCVVACCMSDGMCIELTDNQCINAGGEFDFNQHSCEFFKCPPVNDDCANAIPVSEGTTLFDIGGATTDGDELPMFTDGCQQGLAPENFVDSDVWFTFVPTCTGVVQVDTCGSYDLGDSSNTTIAVYDDCMTCPPSSETNLVVCNNREMSAPVQLCFGGGGAGHDAAIRFNAIAGQCYKIRLGTENGSVYGTGVLNIVCGGACCPPDGFLCTIETQSDCENVIGGFYGGDGSTCDFNVCPGACCHVVGEEIICEIVAGSGSCAALNGEYFGDASECSPGACGGACCVPALPDCVVTDAEDCASRGGNFLGDGVACTFDLFGVSTCATGACCDGPTCVNEVRATCDFDFIVGENCETYVCLDARPGVCCDGIACEETTYGECDGPGTSFYFDQTCDAFVCPDARIGACCLGNETCVEVNVPDCEAMSGAYQGQFETCATADCDIPAHPSCPGAGSCGATHGTPGCSDGNCCNFVCAQDVFCCEVEWDQACVNLAETLCGL